MYKVGSMKVFDYSEIDIDENKQTPTYLVDQRIVTCRHTNSVFKFPDIADLAIWEEKREKIKKQILLAAGLLPMRSKCLLNARIFDKVEYEDYSIEKVVFESYQGFYVTGNLYRPLHGLGRRPGILNAHGHWEKGRLERSEFSDIPGRCANFAKLGFVAFAYDMIGYNDSIQIPHEYGGAFKELWGMGGMGIQLWNSIRAVDFLAGLEDVDEEKIVCTGASGGASQALFLGAVDERIKGVAAVNMVSAHFQGGCCCENAALLRIGISNMEIAAMLAPRPLLLTGSDGDWTINLPTVEYPAIHRIYGLYKQEAKVEYFYQSAPHNYNQKTREYVYGWLSRLFYNVDTPRIEAPISLDVNSLRIFRKGEIEPLDLFEQLKKDRKEQLDALWLKDAKEAAKLLKSAMTLLVGEVDDKPIIAYSREEEQEGYRTRYEIITGKQGTQTPIVGINREDNKQDKKINKTIAVFHPRGKAVALAKLAKAGALNGWLDAGYSVVSTDLFLTGEYIRPGVAAGRNYNETRYFTTFNHTDDAYKTGDICTVLNHLKTHEIWGELVGVVALDRIAPHLLLGLAVEDIRAVKVCIDLAELDNYGDNCYLEHFFVPGFQGIGGVKSCWNICKQKGMQFYKDYTAW